MKKILIITGIIILLVLIFIINLPAEINEREGQENIKKQLFRSLSGLDDGPGYEIPEGNTVDTAGWLEYKSSYLPTSFLYPPTMTVDRRDSSPYVRNPAETSFIAAADNNSGIGFTIIKLQPGDNLDQTIIKQVFNESSGRFNSLTEYVSSSYFNTPPQEVSYAGLSGYSISINSFNRFANVFLLDQENKVVYWFDVWLRSPVKSNLENSGALSTLSGILHSLKTSD